MKNIATGRFKGFTLIELLVVVLIIGILAAVALPQYEKAVLKARGVEIITHLNAIEKAQAVYYLSNNTFTDRLEDLDITIPNLETYNCHIDQGYFCQKYVKNDPSSLGFEWVFSSTGNNRHFCLSPISNDTINSICKSYGGTLQKQNDHHNYYLLP